jgi:biotin carboxyl carrier protein
MDYFTHVDNDSFRVRRPLTTGDGSGAGTALDVEGEPMELELAPAVDNPVRSVRLGGRSLRVLAHRDPSGMWTLDVGGKRYHAEVNDRGQEAVRQARKASGAGTGLAPLKAPMPGMVMRVEVAVGDEVAAGQGLVIVEAMKMENELKATAAARVRAVHAVPGAAVEKEMVLVEFESLDAPEDTPADAPADAPAASGKEGPA